MRWSGGRRAAVVWHRSYPRRGSSGTATNYHDGRWQLNWQQKTLASGQLVKFDPTQWHQLRLELNGTRITGFVDHEKLAEVTDETCDRGMAFLASTYDRNLFDNITVLPVKMSSELAKAKFRR